MRCFASLRSAQHDRRKECSLFRFALQVIHPFGQQPLFPGQLAGMLLLEGYRFVDVWSKGQTDGIGHQHLPEQGVKVFVGQDEGVFLELVGYLAHLAGDIGVGAGVDKLLDKFQLVLVQVVEHQLRVVKQDSGCTTGGFVFLQVGADIGAQLGDDADNLFLGLHPENGLQGNVRRKAGMRNSYHRSQLNSISFFPVVYQLMVDGKHHGFTT